MILLEGVHLASSCRGQMVPAETIARSVRKGHIVKRRLSFRRLALTAPMVIEHDWAHPFALASVQRGLSVLWAPKRRFPAIQALSVVWVRQTARCVPLAMLPGTQALNHAACVQWVLMPHRQWIALNVRQAAFNPVQVSLHALSVHPASFRAHPTQLSACVPVKALLRRMGRHMKRHVLQVHSSIKLNPFARSVPWESFRVKQVLGNVKVHLEVLRSDLVVLMKLHVRWADMQRITRANCALQDTIRGL